MAANVTLAGVNAVTGILAARLLGPSGRGQLAAIQLWPTLLATVALLGLPDALVYFASKDHKRLGRYLGTATALAVGASVVAMALGFVLLGVLLSNQPDAVLDSARFYLLICPVLVVVSLPYQTLRGAGHFGVWNTIRLAPSVLWLGILGVSTVAGSVSVFVLPRYYLIALSLLVLPIVVVTARRVSKPYRADLALVRPLLRYGIPGMAATVPQLLNLRLDQLLMVALLPARELGLYAAAAAWSSAVSPLVTAIGTVAFPSVASETRTGAKALVLARASRLAIVVTVVTIGLVGLVTWPAIPLLFGDGFEDAVVPGMVLVVATGILGFGFVLQECLRGLGLPRAVLQAEVAGLVVSMLALAVLLPAFGILGAALASILGYSAVVWGLLRRATAATGLRYSDLLRPTRQEFDFLRAGAARVISRLGRRRA